MGEGGTFWEQNKNRVNCVECGGEMAMSLIGHHMERTHNIVLSQTWGLDIGKGGSEIYVVSYSRVLKLVVYTEDGCLSRENNPGRLREHFIYRHWKSKLVIIQEGPEPFPRFHHCGMHMPAVRLMKRR